MWRLSFLLGIAVVAAIWFLPASHPASVRVAAIGGSVAFFGVILMALPVLRVGPYRWITVLYFEDILRVVGSEDNPPPTPRERRESENQRRTDLLVQNIYGPYLIGLGTVINGFSGFFAR